MVMIPFRQQKRDLEVLAVLVTIDAFCKICVIRSSPILRTLRFFSFLSCVRPFVHLVALVYSLVRDD